MDVCTENIYTQNAINFSVGAELNGKSIELKTKKWKHTANMKRHNIDV